MTDTAHPATAHPDYSVISRTVDVKAEYTFRSYSSGNHYIARHARSVLDEELMVRTITTITEVAIGYHPHLGPVTLDGVDEPRTTIYRPTVVGNWRKLT